MSTTSGRSPVAAVRRLAVLSILGALVCAGVVNIDSFAQSRGTPAPSPAPAYKADISRTQYGIPHITATDFPGLGYGEGYVYAQDNFCLLADKVVTVNGERSKYFGPDATTIVAFSAVKNLESDFFFKSVIDLPALKTGFAAVSKDYAAFVRGYVAGVNRYLRKTGVANLPEACRSAAWVRPMTLDDMLRLNEERIIQAGASSMLLQINAASPPGPAGAIAGNPPPLPAGYGFEGDGSDASGLGSNGWAFGRDATQNGSGLLLGNPHFPWETTNRFYEVHLTIPGKLDVMGATLGGSPGVTIGFNSDVAWTHTISTDRHFTLFELQLDAADPTTYIVDGVKTAMLHRVISVDVAGEAKPRTRTVYSSTYGPLLVLPQAGLSWTAKTAYALRDANKNNLRSGDTYLDIARATSVAQIRHAIETSLGIPWVNTIATDRRGDVLYADITPTPNVPAGKLKTCAPASGVSSMIPGRIFILDGSRAICNWDVVAGTPVPGLMPGSSMPLLARTDYVANSNDSYWLVNAKAPIETEFSPLIGATRVVQNLRTREGLLEIAGRLDGTDGLPGRRFSPASVETVLYRNRNLAADLVLTDVERLCSETHEGKTESGKTVDLKPACDALAKWDHRMDLDSSGACLFQEFWRRALRIPDLWAVPFDPADPLRTPRGLNIEGNPAGPLLNALASAADLLATEDIALDESWGVVQLVERGGKRIPVHGGEPEDGVLNAQQSRFVPGVGYVPYHGSSYIQVVTFEPLGPVADAILTYSQSTDPASPYYFDQTLLHSVKGWVHLPFRKDDIAADTFLTTEHIQE